jgi:hypothetical protein
MVDELVEQLPDLHDAELRGPLRDKVNLVHISNRLRVDRAAGCGNTGVLFHGRRQECGTALEHMGAQ